MNFGQNSGSNQDFSFGFPKNQPRAQWQMQQHHALGQEQQQQYQWQSMVEHGQQQNFQPQFSDGRQVLNQNWPMLQQQGHFQSMQVSEATAMPQQAAYSNHPGHTAFSNPQAQGATMVVDQNNLKQHKFEEQKRKLREMSNRGMRSNPKGGKSMVDDFLSKTDLNLSSQPKQGADRGGQDRKTNIFSSQSKSGSNNQQVQQSNFIQGQVNVQSIPGNNYSNFDVPQTGSYLMQQAIKDSQPTIGTSMPQDQQSFTRQSFPSSSFPQSSTSFSQPLVSQRQPGASHLQQSQGFPAAHQSHPSYDFSQEGSQFGDDDFGDFQGGSADSRRADQGFNSLNSSTSSLSSLRSSSAGVLQRTGSIDSDQSLQLSSDSTQLQQKFSSLGNFSDLSHHTNFGDAQTAGNLSHFRGSDNTWGAGQTHMQHLAATSSSSQSWSSQPMTSSNLQINMPSDNPRMSQAFPSVVSDANHSSSASFVTPAQADIGTNQASLDTISNQLPGEADDINIEESLYGSSLPIWCHDSASLPSVYKRVLEKSMALDGAVDTSKVYPILLSSNISKDRLRDIWEMANKRNPGILNEKELYLALGLVALAQAGWTKLSVKKLSSCNPPPIPEFPEYILIDSESTSVFGGDSLIAESSSSTAIDPDDKYSVFRQHSSEANTATALSNAMTDDTPSEYIGFNQPFSGIQKPGSDKIQPVLKENPADQSKTSEDWADFQSSNVSTLSSFSDFQSSNVDIHRPSTISSSKEMPVQKTSVPSFSDFSSPQTLVSNVPVSTTEDFPAFQSFTDSLPSKSIPSSHISLVKGSGRTSGPMFMDALTSSQSSVSHQPVRGLHVTEETSDDFGEFSSISTDLKAVSSKQAVSHFDRFSAFKDIDKESASVHPSSEQELKGVEAANTNLDESWDAFTSFSSVAENKGNSWKNDQPPFSAESELSSRRESHKESFGNEQEVDIQKSVLHSYSLPNFTPSCFANELSMKDTSISSMQALKPFATLSEASSQHFEKTQSIQEITETTNVNIRKSSKPSLEIEDNFADFSSHDSFSRNHESDIFSQIKELDDPERNKKRSSVLTVEEHSEFADFSFSGPKFATENTSHRLFDSRQKDDLPGKVMDGNSRSTIASPLGQEETNKFDACADFYNQQGIDSTVTQSSSIETITGYAKKQNTVVSDMSDFGGFTSAENDDSDSKFSTSSKPLNIEDQLKSFATSASLNTGFGPVEVEKGPEQIYKPPFNLPQAVDNRESRSVSNESVFTDTALIAKDRYKALAGDLEDSELHVFEWMRCLNSIKKVFEMTTGAIKRHNLSLSTKKEVFQSEKGKEFFNGLKEVFAIACRLKASIDKSALAKSNEDLKMIISEVDKLWRVISGFSSGLPEFSFPESWNKEDFNSSDSSIITHCGICLHYLNGDPVVLNNWVVSATSLTYGGKEYHSTCANFWCNKVNPVLPALPPLASSLL